jgi:nucleoside-diphosphate-sugar epimerase
MFSPPLVGKKMLIFLTADPKTELVDPAIVGTTSILKSVAQYAPTVRRVVVTSSFAAILDEARAGDPATVFSEASWNPVTIDDIHRNPPTAYRASKKLAEKAAWEFVKDNNKFELVTINPPMVFGPLAPGQAVESLDGINTSNQRIVDLLQGKWKNAVPEVGVAWIWVDVRDVAAAHVKAGLDVKEAAGKRLFVTAGEYSNAELGKIVRKNFPEYAEQVPDDSALAVGEKPPADKRYRFDNSETNKLLGISYRTFEESIVDTVKSLKKLGA